MNRSHVPPRGTVESASISKRQPPRSEETLASPMEAHPTPGDAETRERSARLGHSLGSYAIEAPGTPASGAQAPIQAMGAGRGQERRRGPLEDIDQVLRTASLGLRTGSQAVRLGKQVQGLTGGGRGGGLGRGAGRSAGGGGEGGLVEDAVEGAEALAPEAEELAPLLLL